MPIAWPDMKAAVWILTVAGLTTLAGCGGPPAASEGGFDSADPASRLYAIRRAGGQRDVAAVPDLIESLESDDPAVRMLAIAALQRITGTRMGYDPYALPAARQDAVDAWLEAWRSGRLARPAPANAAR